MTCNVIVRTVKLDIKIIYKKIPFKKDCKGASINHMDSWGEPGEGVSQMTILLHKPYFVKMSMNGKKVKNLSTWFIDDILDDTFSYSERNLVLHILGPHSVKSKYFAT